MSFDQLRKANIDRCREIFHEVDAWSPTDWMTGAAGEAGEVIEVLVLALTTISKSTLVANAVKKLHRIDDGTNQLKDPQSRDEAIKAIADEIADSIIYQDLLAARLGIDLWRAVVDKFNSVSGARGSSMYLTATVDTPPISWQPIATAPKDNKHRLYLAVFNDDGILQEIDFDGSWEWIMEEHPLDGFYGWCSACGRVEEPTHWAFQEHGKIIKENRVIDIPSVEDIDSWHDRGDVGSMYIACQTMAAELRAKQKTQEENDLFVATLVTILDLDREEIERSGRPLGNEITSTINDILDDYRRLSSL